MTAFLEVINVSKTYRLISASFFKKASLSALKEVSLNLIKGETLALIGESGSGKSTLAKIILGLIPPSSGEIRIEGVPLNHFFKKNPLKLRRKIQIVFQDPFSSLNPKHTIREILEEPYLIHGLKKKDPLEAKKTILHLLESVKLPHLALDRYPHEFSGGQRQRIGIARAIAINPDILILDEPVSALDVSTQAQIFNLLLELQSALKLTTLLITHDLHIVKHMADRVAILKNGVLVEMGVRDAIFKNPQHPYTKTLIDLQNVSSP